jgi:predicted methyltransferase
MRLFAFLALCALALAACREEGAADESTPSDSIAALPDSQAHGPEEIPSREQEVARDQGSKPQEVMDFIGIRPGDAVADIFAGSGYYTYLLSQRVGPAGRVYAQGYSPGLQMRLEGGDLAGAGNVVLVDSLSDLPEDQLDAALIIRGYHLFPDPSVLFGPLSRALKPGGVVGVVEVRLGEPYGHDMETHRMGDQQVIDEFTEGGFEYVGASEILRNPADDHTEFWEGRRHLTDRMLLKFAKPGEPVPPATAEGVRAGERTRS